MVWGQHGVCSNPRALGSVLCLKSEAVESLGHLARQEQLESLQNAIPWQVWVPVVRCSLTHQGPLWARAGRCDPVDSGVGMVPEAFGAVGPGLVQTCPPLSSLTATLRQEGLLPIYRLCVLETDGVQGGFLARVHGLWNALRGRCMGRSVWVGVKGPVSGAVLSHICQDPGPIQNPAGINCRR